MYERNQARVESWIRRRKLVSIGAIVLASSVPSFFAGFYVGTNRAYKHIEGPCKNAPTIFEDVAAAEVYFDGQPRKINPTSNDPGVSSPKLDASMTFQCGNMSVTYNPLYRISEKGLVVDVYKRTP